jgi:hypothetical protein
MCVVVLALAAGCQADEPAFESKEFKFKAKFPRTPDVAEKATAGMTMTTFSTASDEGVFRVEVVEGPITGEEPAEHVQRLLDGARDNSIALVGGTLQSSRSRTLAGKYPGREFTASTTQPAPGLLRARVYIVRTRLYRVSVMGNPGFADSPAATAFLGSFQVME